MPSEAASANSWFGPPVPSWLPAILTVVSPPPIMAAWGGIGLAVCEGVADEPPISSGRPQADLRSLDQDDVELRNPLLGLKRSPEAERRPRPSE